METPRKLVAEEVTFSLEVMDEESYPKDHFSEPEDAKWVLQQLEAGNEFAWFTAKVVAKWNGLYGEDYLGGCSYKSEQDFLKDPYYSDMKNEALHALNIKIAELYKQIRPLL